MGDFSKYFIEELNKKKNKTFRSKELDNACNELVDKFENGEIDYITMLSGCLDAANTIGEAIIVAMMCQDLVTEAQMVEKFDDLLSSQNEDN